MADLEPLSQEWREAHCRAGDRALRVAEAFAEGRPTRTTRDNFDERSAAVVAGYATIAQAHYAAANVRAKLAPAAAPETDYPTALESPHGWTSHGHACCVDGEASPHQPLVVARCGGPAICPKCATAAGQIHATRR